MPAGFTSCGLRRLLAIALEIDAGRCGWPTMPGKLEDVDPEKSTDPSREPSAALPIAAMARTDSQLAGLHLRHTIKFSHFQPMGIRIIANWIHGLISAQTRSLGTIFSDFPISYPFKLGTSAEQGSLVTASTTIPSRIYCGPDFSRPK